MTYERQNGNFVLSLATKNAGCTEKGNRNVDSS
jgi:hypothetical protein